MTATYRWWKFKRRTTPAFDPVSVKKPTLLYAEYEVLPPAFEPIETYQPTLMFSEYEPIIEYALNGDNLIMSVGGKIKTFSGTTLFSGAPQSIYKFDLETGRAITYNNNTSDWYILQLNSDGTISVIKHLQDRTNYEVDADFKHNIIVESYEEYLGNGNWRNHLIRYDNNGNVIWDNTDVPNWLKVFIFYDYGVIIGVRLASGLIDIYDLDGNRIHRSTFGENLIALHLQPFPAPTNKLPLYLLSVQGKVIRVTSSEATQIAELPLNTNETLIDAHIFPLVDSSGNDYGVAIGTEIRANTGGTYSYRNSVYLVSPSGNIQEIYSNNNILYGAGFLNGDIGGVVLDTSSEPHKLKLVNLNTGEVIYSENWKYALFPRPVYGEVPAIMEQVDANTYFIWAVNYLDMNVYVSLPPEQRTSIPEGSPLYLYSRNPLFIRI